VWRAGAPSVFGVFRAYPRSAGVFVGWLHTIMVPMAQVPNMLNGEIGVWVWICAAGVPVLNLSGFIRVWCDSGPWKLPSVNRPLQDLVTETGRQSLLEIFTQALTRVACSCQDNRAAFHKELSAFRMWAFPAINLCCSTGTCHPSLSCCI